MGKVPWGRTWRVQEAADLYLLPEPAPPRNPQPDGGNAPLRLKEDKCGVVLKVRSERALAVF